MVFKPAEMPARLIDGRGIPTTFQVRGLMTMASRVKAVWTRRGREFIQLRELRDRFAANCAGEYRDR